MSPTVAAFCSGDLFSRAWRRVHCFSRALHGSHVLRVWFPVLGPLVGLSRPPVTSCMFFRALQLVSFFSHDPHVALVTCFPTALDTGQKLHAW